MNVTLRRTERTRDGVFGLLTIPEHRALCTMEDDEDIFPAGVYLCRRTIYYKHGYEAFEITGIPGRSRILFHPANTEEDVRGCVGVGLRRGMVKVPTDEDTGAHDVLKQAVVASQVAFRLMMDWLADVDDFSLTITDAFPLR